MHALNFQIYFGTVLLGIQPWRLEVMNLNICEAEIVQHLCTAVRFRMLAVTKVNGHRLNVLDQ